MTKNTYLKKLISLCLSLLMIVGMVPLTAFISNAATSYVTSSDEWNYSISKINSSHTAFDQNGPFYISMAIADTNFVFMQTEDNQEFTYTTNFYCKKNNRPNEVYLDTVQTNVEVDRTFANMVTSSSWALTGGEVDNPNPDGSPNTWGDGNRVGLKAEGWNGGKFTTYSYTVNFVANGSATYHPIWQIEFTSRAVGVGVDPTTYNTAYTVVEGSNEAENLNPIFTIQVIDMRELRNLVDMANNAGVDISDITNGRDLSGNTYISQDEIDTMVSALRARLLCDYSSLDAQITRAADVEDNVNGGLGGYLYDESLYAIFTDAYNAAKAVDRYLTDDELNSNQTIINNAASALASAIDNLLPTRKALINYYNGTELFAQNTCQLGLDYNFHDVTDKFIGTPTSERMVFTRWVDINGNTINENTLITGDLDVYADFELQMEGIAPLSSSGKWEHKLSENDTDGRGDNYISMWVQDTTFNFVQTHDNETFSFYTDLTAYKNDGGNTVRVNDVYLLSGDSETDTFISALGTHDIDYYCVTKNSDPKPNNTGLPGALGSGYYYQSTIYRVIWRYIYTFNANGATTYHPKWNIEYTSGLWALSAGDHDLPDGGDPYVEFTINVTDLRELINLINKAESIYNNRNSGFDQDDLDALRAILDFIEDNYTLDGSVYYEQSVVDSLINQIKQVIPDGTTIPCDYTDLDAAIALADQKKTECNNNIDNHYINEVWTNFENAYNAATTVDRNLNIVESNANQTMIDNLTEDLLDAINALTYQTHVNQPCDYTQADDVLDEANQINNDNGKYDDTAYQAFEDAKQDLEDLLNLYDDEDGNNQTAVDNAVQALQDAIDALNDAANQNNPCDYTTLDALIAQAQAINNDMGIITAASYQNLQDALTAALAVDRDLYDNGTNQQIINMAALNLYNAINNLEPDKTLLQQLVDQASALDLNDYTDATAQDLADAVSQGVTVLNDDNATVADVVNAITDLQSAINGLVPDKTELEATITAAQSIDTTNVDPTLASALQDAIDAAQLVDNDANATVAEIKAATEALKEAIANILENAIVEAIYTDTTGMTQDSIDNLNTVITDAETVRDDANSTAQDKADAINNLINAVNALTPDKTELGETIAAAESIDDTKLDSATATALQGAIDAAQTVYNDPDATVDEVQAATDALNSVLDSLLDAVITEGLSIDTTGMTQESINNLDAAITAAEAVQNDSNATAQEKADAINDIFNNVDNLTPDKTELGETIAAAESIDDTKLDSATATALQDAIDAAQTVYNDPDATVAEIQAATDALNNVIDSILDAAITAAENTDTTGMTVESIQNLDNAITDAQTVQNDPNANAQDKADAINDVLNNVDSLTPDKTELGETIAAAESIDETKLDSATATALQDAIDAAQTVYNDPDATVAEIQAATDALNNVIDSILDAAITAAENTDTTGMTTDSIQNLENAITDAQTVQNDPNANAQDKADAINDVLNNVDSLTPDKTELQEAVTAAEGVDTTNVDQPLADALQDAIDNGNNVLNDPDATVQEISDAVDQIIDALKDILQDEITDAQNTDTTGYSDDSVQDLQDAIDHANDVLNDHNATADEIADAIKEVENAVNNLSDTVNITVKDDTDNIIQQITVPVSTIMSDIADLLDQVPTTNGDEILVGYVDESGNYIYDDNVITGSTVIKPYYELDHLVPVSASTLNIDRNGEDKIINGFDINHNTVSEVLPQFENDELCIEIKDINGVELTGTDKVGTGSVITYKSKLTGNVYERLTVVIYGEVDGDGIIGDMDLAQLKGITYATNLVSENAYLKMASDVDGDGAYDGIDCTYISCTMHGIECIQQSRVIIRN